MPVEPRERAVDSPSTWPKWPELDRRSEDAMARALQSGRLAVSGSKSRWPSQNVEAAAEVARRSGRRHAVLTTSGSSSIVVALHALGIGPGDTVALTATTWVSCATSILRVGAKPVFFDAGADSPCGDPATLAESPSAILAIHLYAQQIDIDAIRRRFPGVPVIEDASHAQFAQDAVGRRIGSLGDVSILSLQATKIITGGEGGAVLTDDEYMARRLESLVMDSRRRTEHAAATAANELEAAHLLHGANYSPPEFAAGLLADQLARFDEQAHRRTEGARALIDGLRDSRWRVFADEAAIASGAFYGIVVEIPPSAGSPAEVLVAVQQRTGLVLDTVYPPVVSGPLYLPETIKQFQALVDTTPSATLNAQWWHTRCVVIPHHALLASDRKLATLIECLRSLESGNTGSDPAGTVSTVALPEDDPFHPVVDVVVITRGGRPTLTSALAGAAAQKVDADIRITVWVDGDAQIGFVPETPHSTVRITDSGFLPEDPFDRIAVLRDLAVTTCSGDYLAFLDDDNEWHPQHLAELLAVARQGLPAVHSWRTLIDADGAPTTVSAFPWLPPSQQAEERLAQLHRAGVMSPADPVVKDRVNIEGVDGLPGMVDMGEWLFSRDVLRLLKFHKARTREEVRSRHGEDDTVLEQVARLAIPVGCTESATLRYRLGGMSNPEASVSARLPSDG
ncbi:MAG: DegT/DnrJ/EryC1/StrS family aminotransferase [Catenulispora sp.]